jgi:hypothetical protein
MATVKSNGSMISLDSLSLTRGPTTAEEPSPARPPFALFISPKNETNLIMVQVLLTKIVGPGDFSLIYLNHMIHLKLCFHRCVLRDEMNKIRSQLHIFFKKINSLLFKIFTVQL